MSVTRENEAIEKRRRAWREANARYRAAHPDIIRERQKSDTTATERQAKYRKTEKGRAQHRKFQKSETYKAWHTEHTARPDVAAKRSAQRKLLRNTPEARAKAAAYARLRRLQSPKARLSHRMSAALGVALKSNKGGKSWVALLGFSPAELRRHIERQFLRGMSWDNMGKWHIDHIIPLDSFSYSAPEDSDFRAAWSLTNLRPLWGVDNQKKHAKRLVLL